MDALGNYIFEALAALLISLGATAIVLVALALRGQGPTKRRWPL